MLGTENHNGAAEIPPLRISSHQITVYDEMKDKLAVEEDGNAGQSNFA
jgi:hypothetical protein